MAKKDDVVSIVLGLGAVVAVGMALTFFNNNAQSGAVKKSGCGCSAGH